MRSLAPFLAVALFVLAVTSEACGKPPCTPANCKTGCCDSMNTCQAGNTNTACGANGAMCTMCTLAQTCAAGLNSCVLASSTGGGGGSGGGTSGGGQGGGGGGGNVPANSCNTSGVAMGCMANGPFSCAAATNCFATLADCANSGQCPPGGTGGGTGGGGGTTGGGGGSIPANSCNTTGVAMGCMANGPFSCAAATNCFATLADCANSGQCPPGGTGGGGGPTTSCNTTGIADGCMSNAPFSCAASNMCYPTFDACVQSGTCP